MTAVADAVASALGQHGARHVFGLMGDDTAVLTSAVRSAGISYHDARHENTAVAMAAGYSRTGGGLGVCILSRGPGLTNAITAAVNAQRGPGHVLVVIGDGPTRPPARVLGPDYKALDIVSLAAALDLPLIRPASSATVLPGVAEAVELTRRHGLALLALPGDLAEVAGPGEPTADPGEPAVGTGIAEPGPPRAAALTAAATVLAGAERPLIVAGRGAWAAGARDAIVDLAERTGAVVSCTLGAKDMFAGYAFDAGLIGSFSHVSGRRAMAQADIVLAFGAGLNKFSTVRGTALPDVPLIHVDTAGEHIGRYHPADVAVVGDARTVARDLLTAIDAGAFAKPLHSAATRAALADRTEPYEDVSNSRTVDPRALLERLDRVLPRQRAVVSDAGNFFGFVPSRISVPDPDHFMLSSDFSAIGLGLGHALGAAFARPATTTVLFVGDGGLLMSLGDLETLARSGLPVIVVVMNDGGYGAERHFLESRGVSGSIAAFPSTEFADLAGSWGIEAHTVCSSADLDALGDTLDGRQDPLLLDCRVSPAVVAPFLNS